MEKIGTMREENYNTRLTKIEMALWGLGEQNGLRGKVNEHEKYIAEIKPQLQDLLHHAKSLDEIKNNLWKIIVILVTTAVITVCTKFIQIRTDNETLNQVKEVKAIQEEVKGETK